MSHRRTARRRAAVSVHPSAQQSLRLDRPRAAAEPLEGRTLFSTAIALSGTNLLRFDTAAPSAIESTKAVTGIVAGETLVGIDFRPQNGYLYGLGVNASADTATLYAISIRTGSAGAVGTPGSVAFTTDGATAVNLPDPATTGYGFDFNPAVDRVRVTAGSLNFRINPNSGAAVDGDNTGLTTGGVTGTNPDGATNAGTTTIDGSAYTNNQPNNGNVTTLYTLDAVTDSLYIQNPANGGAQTMGQAVMLAGSPLNFANVTGFDIAAGIDVPAGNAPVTTGSAFAALNVAGTTALYSINLVNAQATLVGNLGTGATAVQGLAVQSDLGGAPAVALNASGERLARFNASSPTTGVSQPIDTAQLAPSETLVGIDYRPQTGQLYGLGVNDVAETATLYLIDPQTGALAVVGAASGVAFVGADGTTPVDLPDVVGYGFDFNPTVDRIRVTTGTRLNFRVNPNNGAPVDGDLGGAPGAIPGTNTDGLTSGSGSGGVSAAAYTNSFGTGGTPATPAGFTTLYTLDGINDRLYIQNPANGGTQTAPMQLTAGSEQLDFTDVNGFDIAPGVAVGSNNAPAAGLGFAVLTVGGTTGLYRIDLATGSSTLVNTVGNGIVPLAGLALGDVPDPVVIPTTLSIGNATVNEGAAGTTTTATVTVTLNAPSAVPVTVNYATADGAATAADNDYVPTSGTLTFAPGETNKFIDVTVNGDAKTEATQAFVVVLSGPSNATIADGSGSITITNDDAVPTFTIGDASLPEGTGAGSTSFDFAVSLSNPSDTQIALNFTTADGTATTANNDYLGGSGQVVFAPGETSATATVFVTKDATAETDETFTVQLTTVVPDGAATAGAKTTGLGTILDDDTPGLAITDVTQTEGDAGQKAFTFTLSRTGGDTSVTSTVDYITAPGTATAGADYQSASGTVTFQPGQLTRTVTVFVNGETAVEGAETFFLNLTDPLNLVLTDAQGLGTIINDDQPLPVSSYSVNDVTKTEGNSGTKDFTFTVTRAGNTSAAGSVRYNTQSISALSGVDYTGFSTTTLNFAPGQASRTVTVKVKGDTTYEQDEVFLFKLSSPGNGATVADASGTGTVVNDDPRPVLSVADVSTYEGHSGTKTLTFTVKLNKASDRAATVSYSTANGTASSSNDYVAKSGSLVFAPGQTSKTVSVTIKGDKSKEGNETFYLNLFNADAATFGDAQGKGTISNDD